VQTSSHAVFAGTGDLLVTGPTETNVNDLCVLLIDPI
jgi:glycerate-2-kinase